MGAWSMAPAGSSGDTTPLLMQSGSGAGLVQGDYVSSAAGLNTYYSYFIEVPEGTTSLQIDIFDLNVGGMHDVIVGTPDTLTRFQLLRPDGSTYANFLVGPAAGPDNAWVPLLLPPGVPDPGHWELRVDTSSSASNGNDFQAYGVRAHDGTSGAGGTELNIYAENFMGPGADPASPNPATGRFHPYITSGCTAQSNDFDWDTAPSPGITFSSLDPARFTTGALPTSGNAVWLNQSFGPWTTDESAGDYGIWSLDYTLTPPNKSVLYVGEFDAGAPPPSQPEPDTFRIYLPTDAGGAPVKPQMGQSIIGLVSGVDPPQDNQDTVLRLAVTINNPTPGPIIFADSASNLVSVTVPDVVGNRVEYAGGAAVTQGTIVTEPTPGQTGIIEWDPTTIPAGGWAQLEYNVLIRPQPSSPRTPITGTPAAGGSTATYVDETCSTPGGVVCVGTALTRATHTLGPLCELAVTIGQSLATRAVVGDLRAYATGRGTVVEWTTLAEHGTVGFHLLRLNPDDGEYERVNDRLLPGLLHSQHGGTYRYLDPGADVGELHSYRLVELEATGRRLEYGPFPVIVAAGPHPERAHSSAAGDRPLAGYARIPRPLSAYQRARREARQAARLEARKARRKRRGATAKVSVRESGLYYLDAAAVGEVLDLPTAVVRRLIHTRKLALSNRGRRVATAPAPDRRGIYFYGEAVGEGKEDGGSRERRDDLYADENVYILRRGPGLDMDVVDGGRPIPVAGKPFRATMHAEGNRFVLTHLFDDPDDDYWMWDFRVGGLTFPDCATVTPPMPCNVNEFPLPSPDVVEDEDAGAVLTVRLHGGSVTPAKTDHRVTVTLNDEVLGETGWNGIVAHTVHFALPAGLLRHGGNHVGVEAASTYGLEMPSVLYVDDLELEYSRAPRAQDGSIVIPTAGTRTVTVGGFGTADAWVLDLADPKRPVRVVNTTVDGGPGMHRVSFVAGETPRKYLTVERAAARTPAGIIADEPSSLRARRHRVDHLIITTGDMVEAAGVLAGQRRAQGLRTMVVDLEDIYDEFNHGIQNAEAIWRFLRYAHLSWRQGPRFVLFAGEGSHDYKNFLGHADAVVPTLLVPTPQGLFPSDNLFADVIGDDRLPEMAVGRIPAMNADELLAVSRKIIAYENAALDGRAKRAIVAADAPDGAGNFPADSEHLATLFPGDYDVERLHLDSVDLDSARRRLVDALNEGKTFMNFIGHGGAMAIGNRGLLTIADLEALDNGDRLPVVTVQTCLAGQFGFPGIDSIGELLVLRPDRGAVAVWAPSGLSFNNQARFLGEEFYREVFEGGEDVLGNSILDAQRRYIEDGNDPYLLDIYNLIGDPATIMK
jgi:hypothetical protein